VQIKEIIKDIEVVELIGNLNLDIKHITNHSGDVKNHTLFICIKGYKHDGHDFIDQALKKGATALLVEKDVSVPHNITVIKVKDTRKAMSKIASNFYGNPAEQLKLIGVTGTNGKTTVTNLIKNVIMTTEDEYVGLIGTIHNKIGKNIVEAERTTPESIHLQKIFREMLDSGAQYVVMEVSSHALELGRVDGCKFEVAVFTNITQDHLDFHGNMENYLKSKAKLFEMVSGFSVLNRDDDYFDYFKKRLSGPFYTYGIKHQADIMAKDIKISSDGTIFKLSVNGRETVVRIKIPGLFSVYNFLATITVCFNLGISLDSIIAILEDFEGVEGRFEVLHSPKGFKVIIDYAHTPDGLKNVLSTIREFAEGRIFVVFGCGGDRDKTKRPIMGRIAGELADFVVITSDNPRSEDPVKIIEEIETGIKETKTPYTKIEDRKEAIKFALNEAEEKDVVLIAGKGHEKYQIFKDKTIPFNEKEIVLDIINNIQECK